MPFERRELLFAGAAAVLSMATALAARAVVDARLSSRAERGLSALLGVEVRLGDAEVGLSGTLRLEDVRLGELVAAEAVEAGVGASALLSGRLGADEVRVSRPTVRARLRPDGSVDLLELVEHASAARRGGGAAGDDESGDGDGSRMPKRILVTGGELVVRLDEHGELRARGVELHPHAGGVRVVTGEISVHATAAGATLDGSFARAGVEIDLAALRPVRAAAGAGRVSLTRGDAPALLLEEVALAHDRRVTRLSGRVAGQAAPLSLELSRDGDALSLSLEAKDVPGAPLRGFLPPGLDAAEARLSGKLSARRAGGIISGDGVLRVDGQVELRHELIAREPVPVGGALSLRGSWDERAGEGRADFTAETGAARLTGELELALGEGGALRAGRLYVDLAELACADALSALPAPLARPLAGLVLDGRIAGHADIGFDRAGGDAATVFELAVDNRCVAIGEAPGADPSRLGGDYLHTTPDGRERRLGPGDADFVPLEALPAHVIQAFVAGEDARFFRHDGFDREQMARSFAVNVAAGRVERGGSTITQQLAKNLWLGRERTISRKLLEAVLAWRLEQRAGKRRILEAYLNVIELGQGVYGLEPAARRWFGKSARQLSLEEAAFLAALTPAPLTLERQIRAAGGFDDATRARVEIILRSMWRNRYLSREALAAATRRLRKLTILGDGS